MCIHSLLALNALFTIFFILVCIQISFCLSVVVDYKSSSISLVYYSFSFVLLIITLYGIILVLLCTYKSQCFQLKRKQIFFFIINCLLNSLIFTEKKRKKEKNVTFTLLKIYIQTQRFKTNVNSRKTNIVNFSVCINICYYSSRNRNL